ncbi:MAG: hypothetical protein QME75_13090 [Deltaproteobacteria bacterium]|nr:hypothetical protein [Deltaproteobacteria bacterium]
MNPATGKRAKTSEPGTWGGFNEAVELWQAGRGKGIGGVGYVTSPDDPFCGVNLNDCRNPETGEIAPWAEAIIKRLNSYTEITPSGCGVLILVRGKLPFTRGRKARSQGGGVAMHCGKHYFAITGRHLPGTPILIHNRQSRLAALYWDSLSWEREAATTSAASQAPGPHPGPHPGEGSPGPLSREELKSLAGTLRRHRRETADIEYYLQALNRAGGSLTEDDISRIARSIGKRPPGLTWKGDPQAARQALEKLGGGRKWVGPKELIGQIMADQNCSEKTARAAIAKAANYPFRYIVKGKNGRKGYKLR